ncbi:MAG: hypothetical protein KDB65_02955 [Calditrichaeota bacterium]|nr:hypothetical protein [Calditrichota bacterium]MCB9367917.1 hypothetical protein [Calditrichota bacterium]
MRRASAFGLVVCLLICSAAASAQTIDRAKPMKSTTGAVFRSLAVPGWGQWYNESRIKSVTFFAFESLFIYGILKNNSSMMAAKRADATVPFRYDPEHRGLGVPERIDTYVPVFVRDTFREEHFFRSSRNKLVWWLVGMKLLSMGDAYVDAQLYKIDISPDLSLLDDDGFLLGATIRF